MPAWTTSARAVAGVGLVVAATVVAVDAYVVTTGHRTVPTAEQIQLAAPAPVAPASPATAAAAPGRSDDPGVATPGSVPRPASTWVARVAGATGIPARALTAYGAGQLWARRVDPGCHLGWNTLAAIGDIESGHGTHGGAVIGSDGVDRPLVVGPPLDGTAGNQIVPDSDQGRVDGDPQQDRAVGPMQFLPATWAAWGVSATGRVPDPADIDDAALTAARYLCDGEVDLATADGWWAAIHRYNQPDDYASSVLTVADAYAAAAGS